MFAFANAGEMRRWFKILQAHLVQFEKKEEIVVEEIG